MNLQKAIIKHRHVIFREASLYLRRPVQVIMPSWQEIEHYTNENLILFRVNAFAIDDDIIGIDYDASEALVNLILENFPPLFPNPFEILIFRDNFDPKQI
jgi:hypothetical protein